MKRILNEMLLLIEEQILCVQQLTASHLGRVKKINKVASEMKLDYYI